MGQGLSCGTPEKRGFSSAVQSANVELFEQMLKRDAALVHSFTFYDCNSALHIAAANGQIEILSLLLDRSVKPDVLNRHKQTPLMLAAMRGKFFCVKKLIEAGANILVFDSVNGRTCLHYSAYHGHADCVDAILSVARSSQVSASWGYSRFVNIRDRKGATPLHLAARQSHSQCVRMLLSNGALVSALTGGYGSPGSTPLHLAARGGSLDCIRELLAWGADRLHRDVSGRIPYTVALRNNHGACAALLNPSSLEPLVWPWRLKFMNELNEETRALLEQALMDANREREKIIFRGTRYPIPSPTASDTGTDDAVEESDIDLCSICFHQACTIQVLECGHQMCAQCTLALCSRNKPSPTNSCTPPPLCPFCRSSISKLIVAAKVREEDNKDRNVNSSNPRISTRSMDQTEGSSSFKSLSYGKAGRGSGSMTDDDEPLEKPLCLSPGT